MVSSLFWRYKMKKIRELRADEIEARVGVVRKNGISLLLYKDARCDMNILDETFGITGWKRHHELINGSLFCTVSIRDENGEWISKQDVGVESYTEAVKGAASDSFKRACFNIGIGRELYTAPFIWVSSDKVSIAEDNEHSMSHIHLTRDDIIGSHNWKGDIDLLNIAPLGIAEDLPEKAEEYELHRLLGALLSSKLKVDEKLDIIGNEFQIPLESDIRKDVSEICNLSQGIEDRAFERGTANGISIEKKEGLAEVVLKLIKKGVSIEQVSDMLDMDIKDVQDIIENK